MRNITDGGIMTEEERWLLLRNSTDGGIMTEEERWLLLACVVPSILSIFGSLYLIFTIGAYAETNECRKLPQRLCMRASRILQRIARYFRTCCSGQDRIDDPTHWTYLKSQLYDDNDSFHVSANESSNPSVLTLSVFNMALCDLTWAFWCTYSFLAPLLTTDNKSLHCSVWIGFWGQFAQLGSFFWYFTIAHKALQLLRYGEGQTYHHSIVSIHLMVWCSTIILATIPLAHKGGYGRVDNGQEHRRTGKKHQSVECWIQKPTYWMTLYAPMFACLFFSIFLLVYAHWKYQSMGVKNRHGLRRIMLFVGAFFLTWLFPSVCRMIQLSTYIQHGEVRRILRGILLVGVG
jgi:hypothetical protein